jgi:hypothetical protein
MTKKIVFNSPRRTSSSYMSELIKHCLPGTGTLFFEKMDVGSTLVGKISYWTTANQNEIQVAIIRNPFDIAVSDAIMGISNSRREGAANPEYANLMLNDDSFLVRRVNIALKGIERYYDVLSRNSDERHRIYKFEDTTDNAKRFLITKDILVAAGYEIIPEFESLYELADDQADFGTLYKTEIVVNPANRTEEYDLITSKINALSDSISFTTVNQKYQAALAVSISI